MTTLHDLRVLVALAVLSVMALSACGSRTEPVDCGSVRAQVLELRTQAATLRGIALSVRGLPGGESAYRATLASADASDRLADTLAVPECAPYPSAS
jgi:hypothetical protein